MPVSRVGIDVLARDRASATFAKIGRSGQKAFAGLDQSAKKMVSGVVGAFAIMAARSAYHMISMAARSADTEAAFARNAARMGMSGEKIVEALQRASKGTVSRFALIANASTAMRLGVARDTETFEKLMKIASMRAKEFGYTTAEAWGFLVRGIGRASPMILDNIGYLIDATTTNEAYALSIGKTVTELTKQERQVALVNQIIRESTEDLEKWDGTTVSAADKIAIMETKVQDLKDALAVDLAPALGDAAEETTEMIPVILRAGTAFWRFGRLAGAAVQMLLALPQGLKAAVDRFEELTGVVGYDAMALMRWVYAAEEGQDKTAKLDEELRNVMRSGQPLGAWLESVGLKAADAVEPLSWLEEELSKVMRLGAPPGGVLAWLEEAARSTEEAADIMTAFSDIGRKYRESYIDESTRFARAQEDIARSLGRRLASIQRQYARSLVRLSKDEARDRIRIARDYAKRVIDINRKAELARIDEQRSFGLAWRELLEDQKRARVDFEEDLGAAVYEAAGKRDALTIRRLQRQAGRERRRTDRDQAVARRRLGAHHAERLAELDRQRRRELEDAQRAHRERLRQLVEQMEERRIRLREQLIQQQLDARYAAGLQLEDARRAHRERLEEINQSLRKEAMAVKTHTQAGWILWQKYYRDLIEMAREWRLEAEKVPSLPTPPPTREPWETSYLQGGIPGLLGADQTYLGRGAASTLTIALQGAVEVAPGEASDLADQITRQVLAGVTAAVRKVLGGRV